MAAFTGMVSPSPHQLRPLIRAACAAHWWKLKRSRFYSQSSHLPAASHPRRSATDARQAEHRSRVACRPVISSPLAAHVTRHTLRHFPPVSLVGSFFEHRFRHPFFSKHPGGERETPVPPRPMTVSCFPISYQACWCDHISALLHSLHSSPTPVNDTCESRRGRSGRQAAHQQRTAEAEQRGGVCEARFPEPSWCGQESRLST
ncbi:hypothetical protein E2C01_045638 [Portunus trituberculatus]|uniref:Uncharacterized protein n=1 Tax=Portunus trituberculatus TaxID=210409 RepID=A0A5B7G5K8_PORTR|nr:hypothetical protein [Portunus trituberculatus]